MPIRWRRIVCLAPVFLSLSVFLALAIRTAGLEAFVVEGPSMEPTINSNERVFVDKSVYGLSLPFASEAVTTWATPALGDIVVARAPEEDFDIVKRVVGVGGDTIEIRNHVVWRNGHSVATESIGRCVPPTPESARTLGDPSCIFTREHLDGVAYVAAYETASEVENVAPVLVPDGYVYLLGDHRDRSRDSRFFGPVSVRRIKGRAFLLYGSGNAERILQWLS